MLYTHIHNTGDSEYCLVSEVEGKVVGFCMGTTIQKSGENWKFGVRDSKNNNFILFFNLNYDSMSHGLELKTK